MGKDTTMDEQTLTKRIVENIVSDIRGRSGLGSEWDSIDEDIQDEIRAEWERAVLSALTPARDEGLEGEPLSLGALVVMVAQSGEPHTMTAPEKEKFYREFYESIAPEIKRIRALRSPELNAVPQEMPVDREASGEGRASPFKTSPAGTAPASPAEGAGMPEYPSVYLTKNHPWLGDDREVVLKHDYDALRAYALRTAAPGVVMVPRKELEDAHMHWNGNINERAMLDALKNYDECMMRWLAAPLQPGAGEEIV